MLRLLGELIALWRWLNKNPADRAEQVRRFFQMEGMGDSIQDAPGGVRRAPKAREYSFEQPSPNAAVAPEKSSGFSAYAWCALLLAFMMAALSDDAETPSAADEAEDGRNAGLAELVKNLVELVCDPGADEAFAAASHGCTRNAESAQNAKSAPKARIDFAEYKTLQFLAVYLTIRRIYGDKDVWRRIVREVAKEVDRAYAEQGVRNIGESVEARMDVYAPFAEAVQAAKRADELTDILANSIGRAMAAFGSSPVSPEEIDPGMRLVLLEAFIDAFRGAVSAHRVSLGLNEP